LLRKIDIALIPWLSFLYLLSFLDRTSIGKWACILLACTSIVNLRLSYSAKVERQKTSRFRRFLMSTRIL
jgi:hypothetical protein